MKLTRSRSVGDSAGDERPVVGKYRVIPLIEQGAMAHLKTLHASDAVQQEMGLPSRLPDDWHDRAIARLAQLIKERRGLRVFLDTCTKCGACTDKCHYFLGTRDPKNMPVARQDLLRSVYRRYFTFAGKWFPWLVGARKLDRSLLDDWYNYFHQCSECRRCTVFCPKGIDTSEVTMAGREILASIGMGQHYSQEIISKVNRVGNNLGMKRPALADVLSNLEEDILDETGLEIRLPLDEYGAEILLVTPSADFFAEPHVDGLIGYAKILHAAGISWTFSSQASEAANFALFTGQHDQMGRLARRIGDAGRALGVRRLVIGECGHAWRVAYSFMNDLVGGLDFLDHNHPRPEHICEITHQAWKEGRIILDPRRNAGKVVTYHDSCNVARGAGMGDRPSGQFIIPRELLSASVPRLIDMSEDTIKQKTFCCGGGGGLLTDDLMEARIKGALPRAQALQAVVSSDQVTHIAAICAICKTQLAAVLPMHDLSQVTVCSLHQLVGDALVLGPENSPTI
ncbi:MAG: sulfate reduction electron transfer complex DsrMKJOP subunit DsrK [Granulosicoccus sp.]